MSAADAQYEQALIKRSNTELKSPIEGFVTSRTTDPGALATPGQAVVVVQFLDWLYLTSSIPIEASGKVSLGQTADVVIDALQDRPIKGTIVNLNPSADPQSRQFGIRLKIPNSDHVLRPGMFGSVKLSVNRIEAPMVVPKEAVKTSDVGSRIQVITDELKIETRTVQLGASDGARVQIISGVKPGERIVTRAYQTLKDGATVKLNSEKRDVPGSTKSTSGRGTGK